MVYISGQNEILTLCEVEVYDSPFMSPNVTTYFSPQDVSLDLSAVNDDDIMTYSDLDSATWSTDAIIGLANSTVASRYLEVVIYVSGIDFEWDR